MLAELRRLERVGKWAQVREVAPAYLPICPEEERARIHASLTTACFVAGDWIGALHHAHECRQSAPVGGTLYTWTLHKLAALSVDMGRYADARRFGLAYLKGASKHPELQMYTPWVIRDLSHVAYHERRFAQAATLRLRALSLFTDQGNSEEAARTAINAAWAFARSGKPASARFVLPASVPVSLKPLLAGAVVAILFAEKRWEEALQEAEGALSGLRALHDYAAAAEVSLLLAIAARHIGQQVQSEWFSDLAALFATRQDREAHSLLLLNHRVRGGDFVEEAAPLVGGGLHVGCSLTAGVG